MRRKPLVVLIGLFVLAVVVVPSAAVGDTTMPSATTIKTAFNKKLKKTIVVDAKGWTVYMFTADTSGTPTCTAALLPSCPQVWPPVRTRGAPLAGKGISASKLGTTKYPGGVTQVTYNRHPLYYFRGPGADKKPGDAKGQAFTKLWYVLAPTGKPVRK